MDEWMKITGGSYIIDVRAIRDFAKSARHIARYASLPANLSDLSIADRLEVMDSMHGRRICGTWGSARNIRLTPPRMNDPEKWSRVGSWSAVTQLVGTDENARQIFDAWKSDHPLPANINMNHVDDPVLWDKAFERLKNKTPDLESQLPFFD